MKIMNVEVVSNAIFPTSKVRGRHGGGGKWKEVATTLITAGHPIRLEVTMEDVNDKKISSRTHGSIRRYLPKDAVLNVATSSEEVNGETKHFLWLRLMKKDSTTDYYQSGERVPGLFPDKAV